ncbi:VWA-like domain-containing protein [Lachnospiraceae bacterium NSJ-143]|nr:VWA-like domain-containing protein [Lachnospiraceae bacterium NSJ-143]
MGQYEIIKKLEKVGTEILETSRSELYMYMKFLALAFGGFKYALSDETGGVGTDGFYIYYSPMFLIERYRTDMKWVNRAYLHMIFHCMFRHPSSREGRQKELWDLSCDIAAEHLIDSFRYGGIRRDMTAEKRRVYTIVDENIKTVSAQAVYRLLSSMGLADDEIEKMSDEFRVDDHIFWSVYDNETQNIQMPDNMPPDNSSDSGGDSDGEQEDENPETSGGGDSTGGKNMDKGTPSGKKDFDDKWKDISSKTQTEMDTFSRQKADEAGELLKYISIENRQRYDYRQFLRRFFTRREVMKLDLDSFDYIYYTYGLRVYNNMPLIEPLEYSDDKKIDEFAVVLDTSASCSQELIKGFLSETYSVLRDNESFFRKINVHIIQCDSKIQADTVITCREDFEKYVKSFEVRGGGGTDFRPAFEYIETLVNEKQAANLKGMLYFTDGFGTYPEKMPPYETAFVFLSESYDDSGVPPWAAQIIVEPEELLKNGGNLI